MSKMNFLSSKKKWYSIFPRKYLMQNPYEPTGGKKKVFIRKIP